MTRSKNSPGDALVLDSVVRTFKSRRAVDGISFSVRRGEVFALLGPNGAGKTTTIEMCEGFQVPDSGSISLLGLDPSTHADEIRSRIGIMLQDGGSYPGVRVKEMLSLLASYSQNPLNVPWLLDVVGLTDHAKTSYRRLSGGQKQRLSLACALVGRPDMVFLDEPTAGLDAQSRLAVWDLITSLRRDGVTVLLTTHMMDEAESLADTVLILDHGRVVAEGTTQELTNIEDARISLETSSSLDLSAANKFLAHDAVAGSDGTTPGFAPLRVSAVRPQHYRVDGPASPQSVSAIAAAAHAQGVLITDLSVDHRSLEDVFLDITGREMRP
ncbi:ABC transporter ATP-binding protein [Corynebacterium kroppenstedtii]|uniref:ABC transporter ATP-binding protein n=1 Tax=Corynebacterium sp. PCR 32 TaxID=3351342 RepID=UPI0030B16042